MIFENLPTTPTAEELIDKAFSRAARAGRAQQGIEAQQSMLQTSSNIISDNLENTVTAWPDFEYVDPFYYELADAILAGNSPEIPEGAPNGVDALRKSLSQVMWASRKAHEINTEYQGKLRKTDVDTARKHRKQAFARLANIVEQVEDDLLSINAARNALRNLPEIDPEEPTIVVAGYPNVGKSSFVNAVTNARGETASYPFTTKGIGLGHVTRDHIRSQLVDTPGLLDRPPEERNEIESQATSALEHLGDCVLFMLDPSEACGYPLEAQLELLEAVEARFSAIDVPVLTVANKADRSRDVEADYYMSIETGENVEAVLEAAIDAIGEELTLPFEREGAS